MITLTPPLTLEPPVIIQSPDLAITIEPSLGGKTTSIRHLSRGHELLFQRPGFERHRPRQHFADWAFGWDDCWPSVNAGGPAYPDHGALWQLAHRTLSGTDHSLTLEATPADQSWVYRKSWSVSGDQLTVAVAITNQAATPLPAFWTLHALVRVEPDMQLRFPGSDQRTTVYGSDFAPHALPPAGSASKFWLPGPVSHGQCGIRYPSLGMDYALEWNPAELPYLGYWVTNGGFLGEHNAAWEPADGYYDAIETARANGALPVLAPGQTKAFSFQLAWRPC